MSVENVCCYMAWEAERMSMLQIGILGVAGVLLALAVQKREIRIWHLYQYRLLVMLIFAISAWEDQPAQRCAE